LAKKNGNDLLYTRGRIPFRKNAKRKTVNGSVALATRGSHGETAVAFGRSAVGRDGGIQPACSVIADWLLAFAYRRHAVKSCV
jgi:hypothetical protein